MAVAFFLSPFIVHRLGNVAYGVWMLANGSVNYLNLLDLGMRSSVLRYINKGHSAGDHQLASDALSAALWVRLQLGAVVLLLSAGLAALFPHFFKLPPDLVHSAQIAVLIVGCTTMISMALGVFGGVVSGLNRYDLQSGVAVVQLVVRVVGVVIVLRTGHGIVMIALCDLLAVLVSNLLLVLISRKIYPQLRVWLGKPKPEILRALWTYSFYAFLTTIAGQLIYQTDNLVVGMRISAAAVTFYAIGNMLCRNTEQFVSVMGMTFVPAASTFEASGRLDSLRALYYAGTRATLGLALPILITLIARGHTFIGLWMGQDYAHIAGNVLVILVIPLMFACANRTAFSIAFGTERHKKSAIWAISEGVANLTLSITLVHWFGIYGVAIGTLIPSVFIHLFIWPPYVHELVGVKTSDIYLKVWGPIFLGSIPFAVGSFVVDRMFPPHNVVMFLLQTIALLPLFVVVIGLIYRRSLGEYVLPKIRSFVMARRNA